MTFGDLPAINACLNGASALFLGAGYVLIRQGRWRAHRGFMLAAFVTSTLFLLCYLTYHGYLAYVLHRGPTRFLEPAWLSSKQNRSIPSRKRRLRRLISLALFPDNM